VAYRKHNHRAVKSVKYFLDVVRQSSLPGAALLIAGCAALLPTSKVDVQTSWCNYSDAQALFEKITVNRTRVEDLKVLGIDADSTPNVASLNHADLLRRFANAPAMDINMLDEGLRACLRKLQKCTAIEIEESHLQRERIGNFWLDFLNFRRETKISGWKFDAIFVLDDGLVVYKVWSGKPMIRELEESRNPLGPFQGVGETTLRQRF
jgi:hypothetical protein